MKKAKGYRAGQTLVFFAALGLFPLPAQAVTHEAEAVITRASVPASTLSLKMFKNFPAYREIVTAYKEGVSPTGLTRPEAEIALWHVDRIRVLVEGFADGYKVFSKEDALKRAKLQGLMDEILASVHGARELCHMLPTHVKTVEKILGMEPAKVLAEKEEVSEALHAGY